MPPSRRLAGEPRSDEDVELAESERRCFRDGNDVGPAYLRAPASLSRGAFYFVLEKRSLPVGPKQTHHWGRRCFHGS